MIGIGTISVVGILDGLVRFLGEDFCDSVKSLSNIFPSGSSVFVIIYVSYGFLNEDFGRIVSGFWCFFLLKYSKAGRSSI